MAGLPPSPALADFYERGHSLYAILKGGGLRWVRGGFLRCAQSLQRTVETQIGRALPFCLQLVAVGIDAHIRPGGPVRAGEVLCKPLPERAVGQLRLGLG